MLCLSFFVRRDTQNYKFRERSDLLYSIRPSFSAFAAAFRPARSADFINMISHRARFVKCVYTVPAFCCRSAVPASPLPKPVRLAGPARTSRFSRLSRKQAGNSWASVHFFIFSRRQDLKKGLTFVQSIYILLLIKGR